jgi:alcohol dehydrogenase class IV
MTATPTNTLPLPPSVTFGAGCALGAVTALAQADRRKIFIVTSPSVLPQVTPLAGALRGAGAVVEIVTGVPPEPTTACCETLRAKAATFGPDLVLAIGGGSVLDVAKLVAALHDRAEPASAFYGINVLTGRRTGLVCVPTTAGTGSEVSPNALLYDETVSAKKAVISPALIPDAAIVDPQLMVSLPPALTATTGLDALTHCLEAYANKAAKPEIDPYVLEGVRLIGAYLPRAVANSGDLEARSAVALGSLYGGMGLGPVNTAGVHALAYPLGGEFHMAHGLSIALLLPHVVRFNLSALPERHAALAAVLGATTAAELPEKLEQLVARCGVTTGLSAHGIPRDAIPRMADAALQVTRLLRNNPREVTRPDALAIYAAAF